MTRLTGVRPAVDLSWNALVLSLTSKELNLTVAEAIVEKTQSRESWKEVMQRMASLNVDGVDVIK